MPQPAALPPGLALGRLQDFPEDRALKLLVSEGAAAIIALRRGDAFFAYRNICPHEGLPLDDIRDGILSADRQRFVCSAHSASFSVETGQAVRGLPGDCRLTPVPVEMTAGGEIVTK